jgi:hypothetical protein
MVLVAVSAAVMRLGFAFLGPVVLENHADLAARRSS